MVVAFVVGCCSRQMLGVDELELCRGSCSSKMIEKILSGLNRDRRKGCLSSRARSFRICSADFSVSLRTAPGADLRPPLDLLQSHERDRGDSNDTRPIDLRFAGYLRGDGAYLTCEIQAGWSGC